MLWDLVSSDRVDLWEISLSEIVDGFVEHCRSAESLELSTATEFALIAAMLVELKCRRMLPAPQALEAEEELLGGAERDSLLARLVECATFRDAGSALGKLAEAASRSIPRPVPPSQVPAPARIDWLSAVGPEGIREAYIAACSRPEPPQVDIGHMSPPFPSVEETAERFMRRLRSKGCSTLSNLIEHPGRREVVVGFLAMLELAKSGMVTLSQDEVFGEITCQWLGGEQVWELSNDEERIGA